MMRFLADMGISPVCIERLRSLGHDAIHLYEQGLYRLADSEIIRKAEDESRVILTSDLDFGYLVAISRASTPSIVLFRLSDMGPSSVSTHLDAVVEHHSQDLDRGAVIVVTDAHIRVRSLPIGRE